MNEPKRPFRRDGELLGKRAEGDGDEAWCLQIDGREAGVVDQ